MAEYWCTTADGSLYCPLFGYRVQTQGRFGKWQNQGLYCDRAAAQFAIDKIYGTRGYNDTRVNCRVVQEAV